MKEYITMKEIIIEEFLKALKIGLGIVLVRIIFHQVVRHKK